MKNTFLALLLLVVVNAFAQTAEEREIIKVLEKESATWRAGDVEGHASCWAVKPYSRILISMGDGEVIDLDPQLMINPPKGMMGNGGTSVNSNYKFHINGDEAWVSHDEQSMAADGSVSKTIEIRMLEKINGSWKLTGQSIHVKKDRTNLTAIDSIRLSDPYILADEATQTYYMTGTGGKMWKSKDLAYWEGPFNVVETDPNSWMGPKPMIWAAELHQYKDRYYDFATFTNRAVKIDTVDGNVIERRASHILVSDTPDGPYKPMEDDIYLPADMPTLDGTFWVDEDGKPYMVYCYEWLHNGNGTIEKIELKLDLSGSMGKAELLFRASDSPWSREKDKDGNDKPNKVTDGPFLFKTETGKLGMLWTSWIYDEYVQGVAYSESGTLNGPWIQEEKPITPRNYGHGMLFTTFDGKTLMAAHSHAVVNGNYHRVPHLFEVDLSGDKLRVVAPYTP
tara:strand:+ start:674 stop:2029 length:1356 start_codon:yes stop_codon:yes gene_type:complete